jgi:hypothetical protein
MNTTFQLVAVSFVSSSRKKESYIMFFLEHHHHRCRVISIPWSHSVVAVIAGMRANIAVAFETWQHVIQFYFLKENKDLLFSSSVLSFTSGCFYCTHNDTLRFFVNGRLSLKKFYFVIILNKRTLISAHGVLLFIHSVVVTNHITWRWR